jgi:glycosyltransferase involved in cell wall biosynthesis
MYQGLTVAVVVPAFNEASKLGATLSGIPSFVDHVLVIDDASQDGTLEVARALRRPGTEVLRHRDNCGVGAAIATGYRRALRLCADVTCVMAGDGQMDPADLPALLAPILAGSADYVKGNRFLYKDEVLRVMPPARLLGNVVLSLLTRLTSGYRHIFDSQCGYTAATRKALLAIDLDHVFPRYGYPNDLLARLRVAGLRVADAPVRPIYGPAWRSGITLKTAVYPISFVLLRSLLFRLRHTGRHALPQPDIPWPYQLEAPPGDPL